jgi:hypothetical protein
MNPEWLSQYLEEAARARLCTEFGCTTCGAMPFRRGVLEALARAAGEPVGSYRQRPVVEAIACALARLPSRHRHSEAVARILGDLWTGLPGLDADLHRFLAGSAAGAQLRAMEAHHTSLVARRAARAARETEEAMAQAAARLERQRLQELAREARAARKAERDRVWKERHRSEG